MGERSDFVGPPVRVAEFFAGIGLMRAGLQRAGLRVIWANDIDPQKAKLYSENFGGEELRVGDIRNVSGSDIPQVELATASFPCTDLSLAGGRAGLAGGESGTFWEFARVVEQMGRRRPAVVLLENVIGFATSHGGQDLVAAVRRLNALGYVCDVLTLDARYFVPQSRPRIFVVGNRKATSQHGPWGPSATCPPWLVRFYNQHHNTLRLMQQQLPELPASEGVELSSAVERLPATHPRWWDIDRLQKFKESLSALQRGRLTRLVADTRMSWRTAYRRTRAGVAVWEIRSDEIAGCLRTSRGGSSRQAIVEAGAGQMRVRWMTPFEYAALQGVPDFILGFSRESPSVFGFGDAVCVPVIEWLAKNHLGRQLDGTEPHFARVPQQGQPVAIG